jgi:hypothetical protein
MKVIGSPPDSGNPIDTILMISDIEKWPRKPASRTP